MKNEKPSNHLLKSIRKEKLLTQQQVPDLLFVCKPTYASWENNYGKIPIDKLCQLIKILEIKECIAYQFLSHIFKNEVKEEDKISFEKDCLTEILYKINQLQKDIAELKR